MSAETKYNEIVDQLNVDIKKAINEACQEIHGDIIPYINDDTEHNAICRAVDIVNDIMIGDFDFIDNYIKVGDWKITTLNDFDHNKLVDILASKAGDKAKDLQIERLERQLKESYESKY